VTNPKLNPDPILVSRFAADLAALIPADDRIGLAVSGGPDSLALLLLAAAARPGQVEAASVDHGLREGSASDCEMVAALCGRLGVPHAILSVEWDESPDSNLQALARVERYALLAEWAKQRGLAAIATAHHADDQAETLLMRLARGSGLSGLRGARPKRLLGEGVWLIRPLLGWRRGELALVVAEAGVEAVTDPANDDPRHDRTRARRLLRDSDWLDPARLAATAHHLAEADDALNWALEGLAVSRLAPDGETLTIDPSGIPRELQRRLLLLAFAQSGVPPPRGPDLSRAMEALDQGQSVTLGGIKLDGGPVWRLSSAPPRAR
jgi:tRNA(Ile)-lysidine synthase